MERSVTITVQGKTYTQTVAIHSAAAVIMFDPVSKTFQIIEVPPESKGWTFVEFYIPPPE